MLQRGGSLKLRQHYEGQLNKYTNVMKGWQFRWFVLNPEKGTLEYHVSESEMKTMSQYNRPRGALHLAGAVISPSEEDSHTFVVNPASGEMFKLRATDAKERQEWITRLRVVAELHSQALSQTNSPMVSRDHGQSAPRVVACNLNVLDAFGHVQEWLQRTELACLDMSSQMDQFPLSGPGTKCTDQDLLSLKATAQTTLSSLEDCLFSLQLHQRSQLKMESSPPIAIPTDNNSIQGTPPVHHQSTPQISPPRGGSGDS